MKPRLTSWLDKLAAKRHVLAYYTMLPETAPGRLAELDRQIEALTAKRQRLADQVARGPQIIEALSRDIARIERALSPSTLEKVHEMLKLQAQLARLEQDLEPEAIARVQEWLNGKETTPTT